MITFGDALVLAVIALGVFFAIRSMVKQKKAGGCAGCSGCGGGCSGCPHSQACHQE